MGGVGVVLLSPEKDFLKYRVQLQFPATNNEAEYEVVLTGLRIAKALGVRNLKLNFNSKLVVRQMTNEYKTKEDRMKRYLTLTNQLVSNFDDVKITQHLPSIEGFDVNYVQSRGSWMDPIITHIKDGNLPADPSEARKVKVRSSRFTILNDKLYKREFSQPYLKCLDPKYPEYVCENHSRPRSLVGQVVRAGYFWPTMQKDVV
ncbi:uncharacterized protein LOC142624784 [Castanea sativa]|uniref:uncharacterized protein LOC142624784 n=1 Tax=Castanea sativa TaxID=21020 RepID=UPI003F653DB0